MSIVSKELTEWLLSLRQEVNRTNPDFTALNPERWPIPFFGDIRTARVLTLGVNPSPTEFTRPRWNNVRADADWIHRLLDYFHTPGVPWHEWFLPWEASLRLIGCSYEDRTAAHLDLSPRATIRMTDAPRKPFCDMVDSDVHWLFESLAFAPSARLVLVAGSIIKPGPNLCQSIVSYVTERAHKYSAQTEGNSRALRLLTSNGRVSLPLVSFSKGPSADDKFQLIKEVFESRSYLLERLR